MRLLFLIIVVAVSSAFYTDSNIKKRSEVHTIGEHYGGGVVFYIDSTGQHGLIAATADQKKSKWYNGFFIETKATGVAVGTGQANTTAIVKAQGAGSYAASVCDELELNGFSDWFLPSKGELALLRTKKAIVGGFSNPFYWSSSENGSHYAWAQNFNNGLQDYGNKNSAPAVRAIRAF
ncbi:MAG: DUF1566 domain-containing protein [Bacteroidota bacterium]